jgi:hypothetical protein
MADLLWPLVAVIAIACATWLGHRWAALRSETDALRATLREEVARAETLAESALSLAQAPHDVLRAMEDRVGKLEIQAELRWS